MASTSTSLLQRLRDQPQPRDWQRLVDLYRPFLTGFLRRHGAGDADAEDLTHGTGDALRTNQIRRQANDPHRRPPQ